MISYEQYVAWAASRYPGYREEDWFAHVDESVCAAETEPPSSGEACPVTVRSNQDGTLILTPAVQRSR